jgi:DNA-binding XRE family transcriptional regulator
VKNGQGRPAVARLDTKSNPLVRAISNKIRLVAAQRGLTKSELAETLGVEDKVMSAIWNETALPGPELGLRLEKWLLDPSLTWKYRKRLKSKPAGTGKDQVAHQWKKRQVWLPVDIAARLEAACTATGYSEEAFIQIAIARLLEHEPTMTTLKQAVDQVEKLLVQRAINNTPHLWAILEMDESVIPAELPKQRVDAEPNLSPLATSRIAETPVFDGPASLIASEDDMLEEL